MSFLERFKSYLKNLFKLVPPSKEAAELREAMLGDLMSRAMDLKETGLYTDDEIYNKCIESLGDYQPVLNELRLKPLAAVKSPGFQRGVLTILSVTLFSVVIDNFWGVGAYTIFPLTAIALIVIGSIAPLERALKLRRPLTLFSILSVYSVILGTAMFFILWLGAGISPGKTWVSFTYIPFLLAVSVAIATKVAKKSLLLPVLTAVPALTVPVYLTASVITGLWHPLWIIILAGVLVDIVILIVFLNRKISLKEKALKEGNLPEDEGDLSEWENR